MADWRLSGSSSNSFLMESSDEYGSFFEEPDSEVLKENDEIIDHVKWQGSQTACQALNQLIRSSINEPDIGSGVGGSISRGWHREPSFDQIPGFSLLSTADASSSLSSASSSTSLFTPETALSKSPFPRPHSRLRPSERKKPRSSPSTSTPESDGGPSLPFFHKTNTAQFMDLVKGVSARVDKNAGVRRRNGALGSPGPGRATRSSGVGTKRARVLSSSNSDCTERPAHGAPFERMKRGPVDVLREADIAWDTVRTDKGKGRAMTTSPSTRSPSSSTGDRSIMDIDDYDMVNLSSHKTPSQTRMPPPPAPPLSRTKRPEVSARRLGQQLPNCQNLVNAKPAPTPRFHPLLVQPPAKVSASSSLSTHRPQNTTTPLFLAAKAEPRSHSVQAQPPPKVEPPSVSVPPPAPAPPSSTPTAYCTNSQSSRPPTLGMRRTHTFPSSDMTSLQKTGPLPVKQRGFKPPLLSASQPQPPSQAHSQSAAQVILGNQPESGNGSSSCRSTSTASNSPTSIHGCTTTSATSSSFVPRSSATSSSLKSSSVSRSISGTLVLTSGSDSAAREPGYKHKTIGRAVPPVVLAPAPIRMPSPPLPEPTDGDPDSSFGDISFDMDADALEDALKMYD